MGAPMRRAVAAMSGGVDSAVAAALAVDAGHDVTGVHLALSPDRQTLRSGARGCCSVEDAHDARRVADELGIPFYVWDLAERFREDVVDDFVAEYAAGRTPEPVPALQREDQVLRGAGPGAGARLRRRRHRPPRAAGRRRAAPLGRRRQGPVLRARRAHRRSSWPARVFPLGVDDQGRGCARSPPSAGSPWPPSPTRTTSASSPTATPAASWPGGWASSPGRSSTRPPARRVGEHDGAYGFTVGQRRGLGRRRAGDARPRYVLGIEPVSRTVTVGTADLAEVDEVRTGVPTWTGAGARAAVPRRGAAARARHPGRLRGERRRTAACASRSPSRSAVWPRGSPRCSTSRTPRAVTGSLGQGAAWRTPGDLALGAGAPGSARCPARIRPRRCGWSSASCRSCRTCPSCPAAAPARTWSGGRPRCSSTWPSTSRRPAGGWCRGRASTSAGRGVPRPGPGRAARRGRGLRRPAEGAGRRAVDAGRRRWSAPAASGPSSTPGPGATWRSRWPRGWPRTSPRSPRGCPGRSSSCSWTSRRVPAVLQGGLPTASGFGTLSAVDAERRRARSCAAVVAAAAGAGRRALLRAADAAGRSSGPPAPRRLSFDLGAGAGPRRRRRGGRGRHPPAPRCGPGHGRARCRRPRRRRHGCRPGGASSASRPTSCTAAVTLTPSCGLAGATPGYARTAMAHVREAARYLQPE